MKYGCVPIGVIHNLDILSYSAVHTMQRIRKLEVQQTAKCKGELQVCDLSYLPKNAVISAF